MRKPVNNETRLINEIWNNTNKHLNEQAAGSQLQYDIDSLDLSDYTPQEQAEIRKQLKAQNFSNLTKFIAKPESGKYVLGEPTEPIEPAPSIRYRPGPYDVDQKGLQKALRYNKNVVVDNKGKKNYVSDMAKAIGWEPPVETREPSVSKTEQPMDAAAREFKATEKYKKMMPGANWAELTADALDRAKKFVGPPKPSDEERADVMGTFEYPDSIFDPNAEKKDKEAAQAKYRKMIPGANWAELTADALNKTKKTDDEGPSIEISAEDLEGGEPITLDLRGSLPKIAKSEEPKKESEFPHWGEAPHGYDPTTPEDVDAAEKWRNRYNQELEWAKSKGLSVDDAVKHAEGVMSGERTKGVSPEAAKRLEDLGFKPEQIPATSLPSRDEAMDARFKQIVTNMEKNWEAKQKSPITQTGGPKVTPGFTPTPFGQMPGKFTKTEPATPATEKEFTPVSQSGPKVTPGFTPTPFGQMPGKFTKTEQPMDAAVAEYKKTLDNKVDKGTVSSSDLKMPYSERSPEPEALPKTPIKWPSEKPAPLPSAPVGSGILTPEEQDKAQRAAQARPGRIEDLRKAVESAKDVAKKASPTSSTYPDLVKSIKNAEGLLGGASTPAPASTPKTTSGRETGLGKNQTAFQPEQTWDEVAAKHIPEKFKDLPITRRDGKVYAGDVEMTAASQETSHYAPDAPTRKQLQETVAVNRYANFITEMAKAKATTKSAKTEKATKPATTKATKKTKSDIEVKPTSTPSVATPASPAVASRSVPAAAVRPVHGGRSSVAVTSPTPVVTAPVATEKASESPSISGSSTAFPKLPEGYKGSIKYKLKEPEVNPYTSPASSEPYFTPQSGPLNPIERYVGPSRLPLAGSMDYSYLAHATKEPYTILSPKGRPQIETKSSTGIEGATTKSFGKNVVSSTGKKIGVGAMGAVLATAAAIAMRGGQPQTPAKTGAPTQVNTQNTPNTQETQQKFSEFEMKLRKSSGFH